MGIMLTLLELETGAAIRPMAHTFIASLFSILGLVVAGPLCAAATLIAPDWRGKVFSFFFVLLSVTPLPLGSITLQLVAEAAGFTLQP